MLAFACTQSSAPPGDGGGLRAGDLDDDGLCDETEREAGTDPGLADSDGDGLIDYVELFLGYDALLSTSPAAAEVHILAEGPAGATQIPLELDVSGAGEDYFGGVQGWGPRAPTGELVSDFYLTTAPIFAEPAGNVALLDEPVGAFRGVIGRTLLGFELRFAYGSRPPRVCARVVGFRFELKRSDGVIVSRQRHLLVVLPPGERLDTTRWCLPSVCS